MPRFEQRHRLLLALEDAGVSKHEMAEILGVGETTIRNYLTGRTHPSLATVKMWALRCDVPWQWIATGEEPYGGPGGQVIPCTKWLAVAA